MSLDLDVRRVGDALRDDDRLQLAAFAHDPELPTARQLALLAVLRLRTEPKRRGGHGDRVLRARRLDRQGRRHSGEQHLVRILRLDDDRVGDDVVRRRMRLADLLHLALELPPVGVGRERHLLSDPDVPDVRLRHRRLDPDHLQVFRNRQDRHRVVGRHDRLAFLDLAVDDDAVHRRAERAVVEVRLRLADGRLALLHGRLGAHERGLRAVDGRPARRERLLGAVQLRDRRHRLLRQHLLARIGLLRQRQLGLGRLDRRLAHPHVRLVDVQLRDRALVRRLVDERIDERDDLSVRHDRVVVDKKLDDAPVHLRADRDACLRVARRHRARRLDGTDNIRPTDRRKPEQRSLLLPHRSLVAACETQPDNQDNGTIKQSNDRTILHQFSFSSFSSYSGTRPKIENSFDSAICPV